MLSDKNDFLAINLAIVCIVRKLQKNFFTDRGVPALLSCKVLFDELATGASKVVDVVSDILTDIELPLWVRDLVNHFHPLLASLLGRYPMLLHPVAQVSAGRPVFLSDPGLRRPVLEECRDFHLMRIQFALANTFGTTQWYPLLLTYCKCFRGSL
jgi:hypothetical protein